MIKEHSQVVVVLTGLLDLAVTVLAWLLTYWIRFPSGWMRYHGPMPTLWSLVDVIVITLLLTLLVFGRMGIYRPRRLQPLWVEAFDLLKACALVWAAEVFVGHFLHSPRISVKMQLVLLVVWPTMLVAYRLTARAFLRSLRRRGKNMRSVAIVGAGRLGQTLFHNLRRQPWTGINVRYFVDDQRAGHNFLGVATYGPMLEIDRIVVEHPVDAVYIALPRHKQELLRDLLLKLNHALVDINVVPDLLSYQFLQHQVQQVGRLPVVNLTHSAQSGVNAMFKRGIDVVFSLTALVLLSPLLIFVALLVKLTSRGPVLYRQRRASLGGREFDILKFRSMVPGAETANGAEWHVDSHDPRVTGAGRWLRRLSLDELPQLINVLRGDMSLVGPRPERPEFIERFSHQIPRYMLRHHVKAGLTGWAQVKGYRGRTSLRKRIQYDLDYITRWSLGFDLYIMLLTLFRGIVSPDP